MISGELHVTKRETLSRKCKIRQANAGGDPFCSHAGIFFVRNQTSGRIWSRACLRMCILDWPIFQMFHVGFSEIKSKWNHYTGSMAILNNNILTWTHSLTLDHVAIFVTPSFRPCLLLGYLWGWEEIISYPETSPIGCLLVRVLRG
jgi:hypothetical protein